MKRENHRRRRTCIAQSDPNEKGQRDCDRLLVFVKMGLIPICIYSGGFDFVIFEVDPGRRTC